MPAYIDRLEIYKGASFTKYYYIEAPKTEDTDVSWVPVDLTGYHIHGVIKKDANDETIIQDLHPVIVEPKEGKIKISLNPEETSKIQTDGRTVNEYTSLMFDIKLIAPNFKEAYRIANGIVIIFPEVSKNV